MTEFESIIHYIVYIEGMKMNINQMHGMETEFCVQDLLNQRMFVL